VIISRDVGELLLFAGRDDETIAQCRKTLEMDPNFSHAHWVLAWAYRHKGQSKEFLDELEKSVTGHEVAEGIFYAAHGKRREAQRVVSRLEKAYGTSTDIAQVYVLVGEKDRAFAFLENALAERDGGLIVMCFAPQWEPLRSDPRFEQLERRVGVLR
jgi:tetratricopeptide (TPR) repeat protein